MRSDLQAKSSSPLGGFKTVLSGFKSEILAVAVFSMVINLIMLAPTLYMLQVFDRVMVSGNVLTLLAVSALTLALFAVLGFADWLRSRLLVRSGVRLDTMLSSKVFRTSFSALLSKGAAQPARALNDLVTVRQFITGPAIFGIFDAPWTPVFMAVLFFLHPWLGVLSVFFALVQVLIGLLGHRHTLALSEQADKSHSVANADLRGALRSAETLEAMGMLANFKRRWVERHLVHLDEAGVSQRLQHKISAWSKWVRYSQQSLALGAGAVLVIDGHLTPGGMIAANVLMVRALSPIDQLVSTWRNFSTARHALARLEALFAAPEAQAAAGHFAEPKAEVILRGVSSWIPERAQPFLQDIQLVFQPGTVTALLGPSGSGKSTLARVMLGIWPHARGDVLLDGLPIQAWDRARLGPYLGYLPQDIELFDGTIADNIARFGFLDSGKVIEAARCTGLHDMILRFPKGYDTTIGEAGGWLSAGQRQRIGLARAVYGNPALIVLDEPNANLDDVGEAALFKTMIAMKAAGKTVVVISHRPGAIAAADRIVVLKDGKVVNQGTRDEVFQNTRPP
ncbi:MAG: type I secretion system permease/ATPase [Hylemonella sp.]|nr:type I secretion system permease/ATPase [Hylemonella sp.]